MADIMPGALERKIFGRLRGFFPAREPDHRPRKLLVVNMGGLGDLIMSTPGLRALRRSLPDCTIHFLGFRSLPDIFSELGYFDKVIPSFDHTRLRNPISSAAFGEWPRLVRTLATLRGERYDTLLLLQPQMSAGGALRMAAITLGLGIRHRVGRNTEDRGFFLTSRIAERFFEPKHEVERVLDVVKAVGASPDGRGVEVRIPDSAREVAEELLRSGGIKPGDPVVVFSPGSRKASRAWSVQRWAELGDRLAKDLGTKIVIVGEAGESGVAQDIAAVMDAKPFLLMGRTPLLELAAILDLSRVVVSVDSGPMHLASALRPGLVALFGPGQFDRIRPYGNGNWALVREEVGCAPCYRDFCEDHKCMEAITVQRAYDAVISVWDKAGQDRAFQADRARAV